MTNCLEFLAKTLYVIRPVQHVPPLTALAPDGSELEYIVFSSKIKIRATKECQITLNLPYPTTIIVQGGLNNHYVISGTPEVLSRSKIIYHGGSGNSVPTNLGQVIIQGGDKLKFY